VPEFFKNQADKHGVKVVPGSVLILPDRTPQPVAPEPGGALIPFGVGFGMTGMGTAERTRARLALFQQTFNADYDRIVRQGRTVNSSAGNPTGLPEATGPNASKINAIRTTARQLGIDPIVLAAVMHKESSFRTTITGGAGDNYQGLIQFGPTERRQYGYDPKQTFEQQMLGPVVRYLKDRGVKPGHGAKEVYAAILTGNVDTIARGGLDWSDNPSNPAKGTTVRRALPDLERGVDYKAAVRFMRSN
jgi:hypothetical protein